jgi:mono/diheme cytochrome c family protein
MKVFSQGDSPSRFPRWFLVVAVALALSVTAGGAQRGPAPAAFSQQQAQSVINQYCATCHNQRSKTGNLELDTKDLAHLEKDIPAWESVVRKLRTGMMPPKNVARPDRATLDRLAGWLETGLDREAALRPNPGSPSVQRLNRNEYANAIRDLLDLEVDVSAMLPGDSTSSGFDNIADVLGTSPSLIQAYLSAAMKISRLAVGNLAIQPAPVTYRPPKGISQDTHLEGMPIGTVGGMFARHNFPLDAEYEIRAAGTRVDLTIDGVPMPTAGRGSIRVPIRAGLHTIRAASTLAFEAGNMDSGFSAPRGRGGGVTGITIVGPYGLLTPGDTPSRRKIFVCYPANESAEANCARQIVKTLGTRAFRQPITDKDPSVETLLGFYQEGRNEGGFETGIERALARILVDPRFIFRAEHVPANIPPGAPYRLNDLELATRLSFFLWSSIPDAKLMDLAVAGQLSRPAVLEEQVRRMLADPKAKSLVDNFASQWMRLRELDNAEPDPSADFDGNLRIAFKREMEMFFESILREDRSVVDLLDADYTFVDDRLARHYGIPNIKGSLFRKVSLAQDNPRRGILGKGSILLVTSASNRTSPVQRGAWVLENLLGMRPPSPPPGVETNLDGKTELARATTIRERMELHRNNPTCAACHTIMDPVGFSLENFDLVGKWRDVDGKTPIDPTAEMVDGTKLDGPASLRRALLARSNMFVSVATEKLMTYATGRAVTPYDMPAVRKIIRDSANTNYRLSALILGVVKSEPFQMRTKDRQ